MGSRKSNFTVGLTTIGAEKFLIKGLLPSSFPMTRLLGLGIGLLVHELRRLLPVLYRNISRLIKKDITRGKTSKGGGIPFRCNISGESRNLPKATFIVLGPLKQLAQLIQAAAALPRSYSSSSFISRGVNLFLRPDSRS